MIVILCGVKFSLTIVVGYEVGLGVVVLLLEGRQVRGRRLGEARAAAPAQRQRARARHQRAHRARACAERAHHAAHAQLRLRRCTKN